MKKLLFSLSLLLFVSLAFTSCKKKEVFTAEDLTHNYSGCPENANQRAMGKVNATSTTGTLTYSIVSQQAIGTTTSYNMVGVLVINASTGDISVKDNDVAAGLLEYYYTPEATVRKLSVVVAVSNGSETKNVNVTINLTLSCS